MCFNVNVQSVTDCSGNLRQPMSRSGKHKKERKSMNTSETKVAPRLLSIAQLSQYTGLGKTKARTWADEIGAVRKIGTRTLFDRQVIDAALDSVKEDGGNDA